MIEIKETSDGLQLYLDNILLSEAEVDDDFSDYTVETHSNYISQKLANYKLSDLKNAGINIVKLSSWCNWTRFKNHIYISEIKGDDENPAASFTLIPDLENWKYPYSFKEFQDVFFDLFMKNTSNGKFHEYDREIDWFEIEFDIENKNTSIANLIRQFDENLQKIYEETIEYLNVQEFSYSITSRFIFPEELKVNCEQYLLYFAQFLRDLGINANSNLKEEAGKVLFSVTPTDDIEALDKIREALAVYLNLPSSPIVYDDSFAAMRLQQQIENLHHSQKMVARELQLTEKLVIAQSEMIQEKNTIISQKDSVIEQQNKVIEIITSESIMIDSLENKEALEEFSEGLKIGESKFLKDQLGIHFNPAKFIKTGFNSLFGKGDEIISILDSDEETEKNS